VAVHIFILLAKELNISLGIFAAESEENNKEITEDFFERESEELMETRDFFRPGLNFKPVKGNFAMFGRYAF
jgi:hypothetical protein